MDVSDTDDYEHVESESQSVVLSKQSYNAELANGGREYLEKHKPMTPHIQSIDQFDQNQFSAATNIKSSEMKQRPKIKHFSRVKLKKKGNYLTENISEKTSEESDYVSDNLSQDGHKDIILSNEVNSNISKRLKLSSSEELNRKLKNNNDKIEDRIKFFSNNNNIDQSFDSLNEDLIETLFPSKSKRSKYKDVITQNKIIKRLKRNQERSLSKPKKPLKKRKTKKKSPVKSRKSSPVKSRKSSRAKSKKSSPKKSKSSPKPKSKSKSKPKSKSKKNPSKSKKKPLKAISRGRSISKKRKLFPKSKNKIKKSKTKSSKGLNLDLIDKVGKFQSDN